MGLHKITANYTERGLAALKKAVELSGDNQTVTLNHAIQIYARLLEEVVANGKRVALVNASDPLRVKITRDPAGNPETASLEMHLETLDILR